MTQHHTTQPAFSFIRSGLSLAIGAALLASPAAARAGAGAAAGAAAGDAKAAQADPLRPGLAAVFGAYDVIALDLDRVAAQVETTGRLTLRLGGVDRELELEPYDMRAASYRAVVTTDEGEVEVPRAPCTTYRGRVAGDPESDVRLVVEPGLLFGYVHTADDWVFIDPAGRFEPGYGNDHVVAYREEDVRADYAGACGTAALERAADALLSKTTGVSSVAVGTRIVEIATDSDFEFTSAKGQDLFSYTLGVLGQVDGIYQKDLGISFTLTMQHAWATAADPYTSSDGTTLLREFQTEWNTNRSGVQRDVAHLFTGRVMKDSAVGMAYSGAMCIAPTNAYGYSQGLPTAKLVKNAAHQLGHNFGAVHDRKADCSGYGGLMCAKIQGRGPNTFSSVSKAAIRNHVSVEGGCLDVYYSDAQFHTTDGRGGMRQINGANTWRNTWTTIAVGSFDNSGWSDLLVYNADAGWVDFYSTDGAGARTLLRRHTGMGSSWDIVVVGQFGGGGWDDVLFYDSEFGDAVIYTTDGAGGLTLLREHHDWDRGWDMIVPGQFGFDGWTDLLFYDRERGIGSFWTTDGQGNIGQLKDLEGWDRDWDTIVPGSFGRDGWTDLFFYKKAAGLGEFYTANGAGDIVPLATYAGLDRGWDTIVSGRFGGDDWTDLVFYDRERGIVSFWATNGAGGMGNLRDHTGWRGTWHTILPGSFGGDGFTDLLFVNDDPPG